jgi:hypothetical protein
LEVAELCIDMKVSWGSARRSTRLLMKPHLFPILTAAARIHLGLRALSNSDKFMFIFQYCLVVFLPQVTFIYLPHEVPSVNGLAIKR